jgi:hypothetical protein
MDIAKLLYDFINTPGIGGIIVMVVFTGALGIYYYLTRWILYGDKKDPAGKGQTDHE